MAKDYHELAVFFELAKLPAGEYQRKAWETFVKTCSPSMLRNCQIFTGETDKPAPQSGKLFCIAIRTSSVAALEYLKAVFSACDDPFLARPVDRIREIELASRSNLKYRGRIDSEGRLITNNWNWTDHDLCKAHGWAYAPRSFPPYLGPDVIEELERMSEPGYALPVEPATEAISPGERPRKKKTLSLVGKQVSYAAVGLSILVLLIWSLSGGGKRFLGGMKDATSERLQIGEGASSKRKAGFAMTAIRKIPRDLEVEDLNRKLEPKYYHVLGAGNSPYADVWLECSIWFSTNEVFRPDAQTITQAFIKMDMRALDDTLIWTCLSKGTRSAPGKEADNQALRSEALKSAIAQIDTSYLSDGKSVRSFQEQRDFGSIKQLAEHLVTRSNQMAAENVTRQEWEMFRRELLEDLAGEWVMTQRVELTSGASLRGILLEEHDGVCCLRIPGGVTSIPAEQVKLVKALSRKEIADLISKGIKSKQDSPSWWKEQIIEETVEQISVQCTEYGAHLPGTHTVEMRFEPSSNEMEAVVKTARSRYVVKPGDEIEGYRVVGMDKETNCTLVMKGEGGTVLRIWPDCFGIPLP